MKTPDHDEVVLHPEGARVLDIRTGRQGMTVAYSRETDIYYLKDYTGGVWLAPARCVDADPAPPHMPPRSRMPPPRFPYVAPFA